MGSRVLLFVASAVMALGCSAGPERPAASAERSGATYAFDYVALDGSHFSSVTTRGRRTVIVVVTTYDLVSQIVVREVMNLARTETPRINAGFVVLEPPKNQPLVEAFVASLEVNLPVAMADAATLGGRGPFGEVAAVPTTLVLDAYGRLVLRHEGGVTAAGLREALSAAAN